MVELPTYVKISPISSLIFVGLPLIACLITDTDMSLMELRSGRLKS